MKEQILTGNGKEWWFVGINPQLLQEGKSSMLERRAAILNKIQEEGRVSVSDLSRELHISEVTIRSDIRSLDAEGMLHRVRGGAVAAGREKEEIPGLPYPSLSQHVKEKRAIAEYADSFIADGDTIILDDASTTYFLAEIISRNTQRRLNIVTNSFSIGVLLWNRPGIELYMVGGGVGGNMPSTVGEEAASWIEKICVEKAFIGVHGLNIDVGLTSVASPQMLVKKAILKAARETYVLADSSKFDNGYLSVICPAEDVHMIITDSGLGEEDRKKAERKKLPLAVVDV